MAAPDTYPYYEMIKTPSQIGMGPGSGKINKNIKGLQAYGEVLIEGGGRAAKGGQPLGNKYFFDTGTTCLLKDDSGTENEVRRFVYVNNVPDGTIPFTGITGAGTSYKDFRGLLPGILGDITDLNPMNLVKAFTMGSNPPCQYIEMPIRDNNNNESRQYAAVANEDIEEYNPCWFPKINGKRKNPVSGLKCQQAFTNINTDLEKDDKLTEIYFGSLTILAFYIFLKIYNK